MQVNASPATTRDPTLSWYDLAYAASGLIKARLGAIAEATLITSRVSAIAPNREFGATTVLQVLTHPDEDEE